MRNRVYPISPPIVRKSGKPDLRWRGSETPCPHHTFKLTNRGAPTMTFTGLNYLAIVIAAVVAWLAGAVWYMSLGKAWMAALGWTPEKIAECKSRPHAYLPSVYVFA